MAQLTERVVKDFAGRSDLPPLPAVALQLVATLGRNDTYMEDVAEIVRQDPAIASQVLRAANSAALGGRARIETISEALPRLGLLHVRRIALVASARTALPAPKGLFPHESFWAHSLAVAHACEIIANRSADIPADVAPEVMFLAGLLHDIGLLALACYYPEEYAAIASAAESRSISFYEAEQVDLSTDHGEIGATLASHWQLPASIVAAIRTHHRPRSAEPEHRLIARIVHLADHLAARAGAQFPQGTPDDLDQTASVALGVGSAKLFQICAEIRAEVRRAAFIWLSPDP
jgi:putative nucleotidyltransferase with HDIG domain